MERTPFVTFAYQKIKSNLCWIQLILSNCFFCVFENDNVLKLEWEGLGTDVSIWFVCFVILPLTTKQRLQVKNSVAPYLYLIKTLILHKGITTLTMVAVVAIAIFLL